MNNESYFLFKQSVHEVLKTCFKSGQAKRVHVLSRRWVTGIGTAGKKGIKSLLAAASITGDSRKLRPSIERAHNRANKAKQRRYVRKSKQKDRN